MLVSRNSNTQSGLFHFFFSKPLWQVWIVKVSFPGQQRYISMLSKITKVFVTKACNELELNIYKYIEKCRNVLLSNTKAFHLFAFLIEMLCLSKINFSVCLFNFCLLPGIFFSIPIMFVFRLYNISFCIRLFNYGRHTTAVQENNKEIFTMWVKYMKRNTIFLFSSLLLSQNFPPGDRQKRSSQSIAMCISWFGSSFILNLMWIQIETFPSSLESFKPPKT